MRPAAFSSDAPPLYALRIVEIVMVGISLFVRKRKKRFFFFPFFEILLLRVCFRFASCWTAFLLCKRLVVV